MQDFIQFTATNNESLSQTKQDKWLTKDRLWNLIFWFGMSLGTSITAMAAGFGNKLQTFSYWSSFFFWVTIIGVPLILKIFNGTKFIKALTFANSEGQILTEEQRPYLFGYAIFAGLPTAFAIAETVMHKAPENFMTVLVLSLCGFAPVSIYFIYKNCPISILFNSKFWTIEGNPNVALLKKLAKVIKED
jgi:hypothetical protein